MLKKHYKHSGLAFIIVLTAIPLFFWLSLDPLALRFAGLSASLRSLGQVAALAGTVLLSLNFLVALRSPILERLFESLDLVYLAHHRLGAVAFILLLVHPVLLAYALVPLSLDYAFRLLVPTTFSPADLPVAYGRFALFIMTVLLIMTFYIRPRYHIWKMSHRFLGLALFLAGLHVFFISSDVSRSPALKFYILALMSLGLAGGLYRAFIGRQAGAPYQVKAVRAMPGSVTEIEAAALGQKMSYEPGQFAFFKFEDPALGSESHPFSLASSPDEPGLRVSAKALGDYTARLRQIKPGTMARVDGPFGRFNFRAMPGKRQVWIAGGIGITPFLGMARQLAKDRQGMDIDLFYAVRAEAEAAYLDELTGLAGDSFRVHSHFSKTQGRLAAGNILESVKDWQNADFLICGPVPMMRDLKKQLTAAGVSNGRMHSEEFEL